MARGERKVKRFVIDVNSYVTLFINKETDWLLQYIAKNNIEIFIDDHLIAELSQVRGISENQKKILPLSTVLYIGFVKIISTHIVTRQYNFQSPDIEDDYLFDLALSSHSKILVTGEKALLKWADSPVEIISLSAFKKLF